MLKNMLTSAKKVGIPLSDVDFYLSNEITSTQQYGTPKFNTLTIEKIKAILDAVIKHGEVLYVDADIVFFKDCRDDVFHRALMCDGIFQNDYSSFCSGFAYLKRTQPVVDLLYSIVGESETNNKCNDQQILNTIFHNFNVFFSVLPHTLYPNGDVWWKAWKDRKDGIKEKAYMVHNNFIKGYAAKQERFKESGLWNIDESILDGIPVLEVPK
jgi:lipopolysaccharide biosynthesis glycosyltransferase